LPFRPLDDSPPGLFAPVRGSTAIRGQERYATTLQRLIFHEISFSSVKYVGPYRLCYEHTNV